MALHTSSHAYPLIAVALPEADTYRRSPSCFLTEGVELRRQGRQVVQDLPPRLALWGTPALQWPSRAGMLAVNGAPHRGVALPFPHWRGVLQPERVTDVIDDRLPAQRHQMLFRLVLTPHDHVHALLRRIVPLAQLLPTRFHLGLRCSTGIDCRLPRFPSRPQALVRHRDGE